MATLILGGIGAAIGSTIPGFGAWKGFQIGATLGSLLEGQGTEGEFGRVSDRKITGSQYGAVFPLTWNRARVGGIVIDLVQDSEGNHLAEHSRSVGGGGGSGMGSQGGTEYWYTASYAVAFRIGTLCFPDGTLVHRAVRLKRIWEDDKLVYERGVTSELILDDHFRFYVGSEAQSPDSIFAASLSVASDLVPAYRGVTYVVFEDRDLSDYGNRIPNYAAEFEPVPGSEADLADILGDLARLSGRSTSEIDFSECDGVSVRGFVLEDVRDSATPMAELAEVFGFDIVDLDGKLQARARGGATSFALSLDELGVSSGDPVSRVKRSSGARPERPAKYEVSFLDASASLQRGIQSATRQIAPDLQNVVTTSIGVVLSAPEAGDFASRKLDEAWTGLGEVELSLFLKRIDLAPGDVGTVPIAGTNRRIRITKIGTGPLSEIRATAVFDGAQVVSQASTGSGGEANAPAEPAVVVPSVFVAWSGVEVQDSHRTSHGFYVAATGPVGWRGGAIHYSEDEVSWIAAGNIASRGVFGESLGVLSASGAVADTFDNTNTVSVDLALSGGSIEPVSDEELLGGVNHAVLGDEILGVGTPSLVSGSTFALSHLRRGERGSVISGHASGDLFCLLNSAVKRVSVREGLEGQTVYVRVVSAGQTISDVASVEVVIAPRTPTDVEDVAADLASHQSASVLDHPDGSVTLVKIEDIAAGRVLGNNMLVAGPPMPLTVAELLTMLGLAVPGADGQLIFNNSGAFGASVLLNINKTTGMLTIGDVDDVAGYTVVDGDIAAIASGSTTRNIRVARESYAALNDVIGVFSAADLISGTFTGLGRILYRATEAHSSTARGTSVEITRIANGTTTQVAAIFISEGGSIVLNPTGIALATTTTKGFTYIGNCAGRPTGVPESRTGATPLVYDTANQILWAYSGSWFPVGERGTSSTTSAAYTIPVHETCTFVGSSHNMTLPAANSVKAGHQKTIILTGNYGGSVVTATAGDTVLGTIAYTTAGQQFRCVSDGVNKWWCTRTT